MQQQQQNIRMQILNHQQMQQQMAAEKMQQEPRMQRPPNMPNPSASNPNQSHPAMMSQQVVDTVAVQPPPPPQVNVPPGMARKKIWSGVLEWFKKEKSPSADKVPQQVPCYVTAKEGDPDM